MQIIRHFAFLLCFTLFATSLSAQDFHKSLFNLMPLSVNPAYTGDFEGTFRVGGMYKDQHSSTFKTPSFFVDVPIITIRKGDWISAGVTFDADRAGSTNFRTTRSLLSVSYHLSLDNKGKRYLIAGYQWGADNRKIDRQRINLADPTDNVTNNLPEDNSTNINNIGLMYRAELDKNTLLNIGAAYNYFIRQSASVSSSGGGGTTGGGGFRRPAELVLHGLVDRNLNKTLSIHPSFIVRSRGFEGTEVMVQAMVGYLFKPDIDLRLRGGLGYDIDQGPAVLLGADYQDWRFGLSFEIPLYGIAEAIDFGGFEITASKIIKVYKKPTVEPAVCCPDL